MKELWMSIQLLFNTVGGSIDPKFSDERITKKNSMG